MNTHRYPDSASAAEACGARAIELLEQAIKAHGKASLAISGGSSPKPMYAFFARTKIDWGSVHLFWVDERGVPPTDGLSNFKLANETWLQPAQYPAANIHRIKAELDAKDAARLYEADIRAWFGIAEGEIPQFDVMHLGMGPDAHTASLFPGEPMIQDTKGVVAALWVEKMHQFRITVLPAVIAAARNRIVLVAGADKVAALQTVWNGPRDPLKYPSQIVPKDGTEWFLDEAAAKGFSGTGRPRLN